MERRTLLAPITMTNLAVDEDEKRKRRPRSFNNIVSLLHFNNNKHDFTIHDHRGERHQSMSSKKRIKTAPPRPFHPSAMLEALRWSSQDSRSSGASQQRLSHKSFVLPPLRYIDGDLTRANSSHSGSASSQVSDWQTNPPFDFMNNSPRKLSLDSNYASEDEDAKSDTMGNDEFEAMARQRNVLVYRSASTGVVHPALRRDTGIFVPASRNPSIRSRTQRMAIPSTLLEVPTQDVDDAAAEPPTMQINASSPPRTDFYGNGQFSILPRCATVGGQSPQAAPSSSAVDRPRFQTRPEHGRADNSNHWTAQEKAFLSGPAYQQLVSDYRTLAEPRMSVFDDDDEDESGHHRNNELKGAEDMARAIRFAPRPLFWSRASNDRQQQVTETDRPTQTASERYHSQMHRSSTARLKSLMHIHQQRNLPEENGDRSENLGSPTSLSSRRATGKLLISSPIPMDEATYSAVVRDHRDALTPMSTPPLTPQSSCFTQSPSTPSPARRRAWQSQLSPRKLATSMDNMRASFHQFASPTRRKSGVNCDNDLQLTPARSLSPVKDEAMELDSNTWLPESSEYNAESNSGARRRSRDAFKARGNKNLSLLFDKLRPQSPDTKHRRRTATLKSTPTAE